MTVSSTRLGHPLLAAAIFSVFPAVFGGCSGPRSPAAATPVPPASPVACRLTDAPITIDGALDDVAWNNATIENISTPWLGKDCKPASKATRAKVFWDRENRYIAADMDDADLHADITEHDGQASDRSFPRRHHFKHSASTVTSTTRR